MTSDTIISLSIFKERWDIVEYILVHQVAFLIFFI